MVSMKAMVRESNHVVPNDNAFFHHDFGKSVIYPAMRHHHNSDPLHGSLDGFFLLAPDDLKNNNDVSGKDSKINCNNDIISSSWRRSYVLPFRPSKSDGANYKTTCLPFLSIEQEPNYFATMSLPSPCRTLTESSSVLVTPKRELNMDGREFAYTTPTPHSPVNIQKPLENPPLLCPPPPRCSVKRQVDNNTSGELDCQIIFDGFPSKAICTRRILKNTKPQFKKPKSARAA